MIGKQFVRACLKANDTTSIRAAREKLFEEGDELDAFNFVRSHLQSFGVLPDKQIIKDEGVPIARVAKQPVEYYLTKLRERLVFKNINERVPSFKEAMEQQNVQASVDQLRQMLAGATDQLAPNSFSTLDTLAQDVVDDYNFAKNHPGLRGVTLAFPTLDALTLGAQGGDIVVVAGRTGMGKSWVMSKMAHGAWITGHSILFVSMEMSLVPIARRFVGIHSAINPKYIRAGELSEMAEQKLLEEVDDITQTGANAYFLSGDFKKEVGAIEEFVDEYDTDAIYIDAAYLLSSSARRTGGVSKWEQIAAVIQELKQLALRVNKPIIISMQMNRNVNKRSKKNLDTSDIAGSDSAPQDASIIVGLRQGPAPFEQTRRIGELMKNREGEEARFDFRFSFAPVNFDEVAVTDEESGEMTSVSYML